MVRQTQSLAWSRPAPYLTADVDRNSEELAVAGGCRNYFLPLGTRDGRHEIQRHGDPVCCDAAGPTASQLPVDHDEICDKRLTWWLRTRLSETLADRAAILESDEILVVVRQQMSDRRPLHFGSYRFAQPVRLTAFDILLEIIAGQLNRSLHIGSCKA